MLSALRPRLLAACVCALASSGVGNAQSEDDLSARVQTLRAQADLDTHTRGALRQTEHALSRAALRREASDPAGSARAERIARAALALAERRRAEQLARIDLAAAQQRVRALASAIERERAALAVARDRTEALRRAFQAALATPEASAQP